MTAIAKRYARAAVETAQERNTVESLVDELQNFWTAFRTSEDLRAVLTNPALVRERDTALKPVFQQLGLSTLTQRLIQLLSENERIEELESVVNQVIALTDAHAGRLRAQVRSAVPLTDTQLTRVARALEKRFGQQVAVTPHVEPELLGGVVCQVGDLTIDNSVRRQLHILRERLDC